MDIISTNKAPAAIGPYSQAIAAGGMVYCSGQIPLDPVSMELVGNDVASQTVQVWSNLKAVLLEAGSGVDKIVKTTVYLKDMNDFIAMNEVYEKELDGHAPARATVEVSRLPKDVLVEIDCLAMRG